MTILRERIEEFIGKPYRCSDGRKACILFALAMVAPDSDEYMKILERVENMKKFVPDREALRQDYIRKFIRTTNLRFIDVFQVISGDLLLMNIYNKQSKVDHLGVYIGNGEFVHFNYRKNIRKVRIERIDDFRRKILGVVRALDYGTGI